MTIGDVLAVVAVLSLLGASGVATLLLAALAFPERTVRAQQRIETAPGVCLLQGLGVLLVVGLFAVALGQSPAGALRLLAGVLWAGLFALATPGGAGIVRLLSRRIHDTGSRLQPFAALTRGALLFVMAGFLPIVGWFLIVPAALLLSLGAGLSGLRTPQAKPQPAPNPESAVLELAP